jgi:hypothetical protein
VNTKLKAAIEEAIQGAIDDNCEDGLWERYIHPELVKQMTNAAETVFDSAQDAQKFFEQEDC